jgi:hypothetical protein
MRYINTNEKITIPAKQIPLSELEIIQVVDTGTDVTLSYFHPSFDTVKTITLWNEEEYAIIGNWTDEDVDARMIELKDSLM